jgi:hypothetical protein
MDQLILEAGPDAMASEGPEWLSELKPNPTLQAAQGFARRIVRDGFLPRRHFIERLAQRGLGKGIRFDPRTFRTEFYRAAHYRQTRPGYNARIAVVRGLPILYRVGGRLGNRIVLAGALDPNDPLPPTERTGPPRPQRSEVAFEAGAAPESEVRPIRGGVRAASRLPRSAPRPPKPVGAARRRWPYRPVIWPYPAGSHLTIIEGGGVGGGDGNGGGDDDQLNRALRLLIRARYLLSALLRDLNRNRPHYGGARPRHAAMEEEIVRVQSFLRQAKELVTNPSKKVQEAFANMKTNLEMAVVHLRGNDSTRFETSVNLALESADDAMNRLRAIVSFNG